MALQSSGPISLNDIATEFGGSPPHSMFEYGAEVKGSSWPLSPSAVSFADFYGASSGPPSSGLIMHMEPSNYSSGNTWNDSAGTNNKMTKVGSPSYTSSSPEYFTTSNNNHWQVTTRPTGSYAAATFIAWVYRSADKIQGIFDIRYGNGTQFGMEGKNGGKFGYLWNNNNSGTWSYDTGLTMPTNAWCMVGVAVNSSSVQFFLRKSSAESINDRNYSHSSQTIGSTSTIYYGADPESSGRGWVGRLGHFYMYNRKISTAEFRTIYNLQKSYYGH